MPYLYETHLHTCEASACGKTPGREYPEYMKKKGYDGMIVTDHFFNGNCRVDRSLPWEERVRAYCSGYEHAWEAARGMDFDVFFGVEFNFQGDEYLLYGITPEWLLAHPEVMTKSRRKLYEMMHEAGAIMVHAHPYRERDYLDTIHLAPSVSDAIEIYNAGNEDYQNALDYGYAMDLGLPVTAGSDIHSFRDGQMGGMLFERKLTSVRDYARAVLAGEGVPVCVMDGNIVPVAQLPRQCVTDQKPYLPVVWHDEQED